jgi:glutathione S-transferase
MHAGFQNLRRHMWMNLGRDFSALEHKPEALDDVARIEAVWADARRTFAAGGPYLFGNAFSAADIMFAPVVTRLLTWRPAISRATQDYADAVRAHPLISEWYEEAAREPADWLVDDYELT